HFDIVHAHFIFPDGFVAWRETRKRRIPYVITAHGSDVPSYNKKGFFKVVHPLLLGLWRLVTASCAEIVSPSDALAELIHRSRPGTAVTVIPNAIDTEKFSPRPKTKRVLVATRFVKRKGVQYLLRAMQGYTGGHPLLIAGGGEYEEELRKLNEELGNPGTFVGWMDNE